MTFTYVIYEDGEWKTTAYGGLRAYFEDGHFANSAVIGARAYHKESHFFIQAEGRSGDPMPDGLLPPIGDGGTNGGIYGGLKWDWGNSNRNGGGR